MYWYASISVTNEYTGASWRQNICVATEGECFPVCDLKTAVKEIAGDDAEVFILNTVPISEKDYRDLCTELETENSELVSLDQEREDS